jgi:hypothetical protein
MALKLTMLVYVVAMANVKQLPATNSQFITVSTLKRNQDRQLNEGAST